MGRGFTLTRGALAAARLSRDWSIAGWRGGMPARLGVPRSLLPFPGQSHLPKPPSPATGHQPVPNPRVPPRPSHPSRIPEAFIGLGEPDSAFPSRHTLPVTLSCPSSVYPRCPQALTLGTEPARGTFVPAHHCLPP